MVAIVIVWLALYCVRNTTQDLIYAVTGRVPPSFVREQRRVALAREAIAARAAARPARRPITASRADRKFFRNAYNDAWEAAEERRERWAEKRTRKRHAKWGTKSDEVPAPIETSARPEEPLDPGTVVHKNSPYIETPDAKQESLYQRYAMRRRNGGQSMSDAAIASELGMTLTNAYELRTEWDARFQRESAEDAPPPHLLDFQQHSRCRDCGGKVQIEKDAERPGQWIVKTIHTNDDCPQNTQRPTPREEHDQQVSELADAASETPREDTRSPGSAPSPETEESPYMTVNAETTGLQSALAYTSAMAEKSGEGATSVETSIASLQQGEVGDAVTGHLTQAQEHLTAAQAAFQAANEELTQHVNVQEAYSATPDAGNKQFVTAE